MVAGDRPPTTPVKAPIRVAWADIGPRSLAAVTRALDDPDVVWDAPDEPAIVTEGRIETITAGGEGRFRSVRRAGTELFSRIETDDLPETARPRLFGGFSFFGSERLDTPWAGFPPARFVLPAIQVGLEEDRTVLSVFERPEDPREKPLESTLAEVVGDLEGESESILDSRSESQSGSGTGSGAKRPSQMGRLDGPPVISEQLRTAKADWQSRVEGITTTIRDSALRKVVLAQALDIEVDGTIDIDTSFQRLGDAYPDCYRFSFRSGNADGVVEGSDSRRRDATGQFPTVFVGASPERLVQKSGTSISTEALAGTMDRGDTTEADEANAEHLRTDPKLQEEHDLVVEQVQSQLDRIGTDVTVGERSVRKLATVQHLQSPLRATVDADVHVLDIVEVLHPTPAVGGLPPDAALAVIREHDPIERGWYAAPVGWFDADGDGTFAVAIRSALAGGNRATLFAGNGIVADSDPETEWDEVGLKFRPIRSALE